MTADAQRRRSNPYLAERRLRMLQRLRRLRAEPAETAVLAFIGLAAVLIAGVTVEAAVRSHGGAIVDLAIHKPAWCLAGAGLSSMLVTLTATLQWRAGWQQGWLAAVPDARTHQHYAQWILLLRRSLIGLLLFAGFVASLKFVAGVAVLPRAGWMVVSGLAGAGIAVVLVPIAETFPARLSRLRLRPAAKFPPRRAQGSLACWQRAAIGRPRAGIGATVVLLLIPGGESLRSLILLGVAGVGASLVLAAWRQSTAVIVRAQALLRAQPLPGRRLVLQVCGIPAMVAGFGTVLCVAVLADLGLPLVIAGLMLAAIWAIALLHLACVCAWRETPRRIAASFWASTVLLGLVLQLYPPLLPLLWGGALILLGRRAFRV